MPNRQLADAGAQSTVTSSITAVQTSVTLVSASGFPAILAGAGQLSVIILDSGNPAYSTSSPLATPYEYQPVNAIASNTLTFGTGGAAASRAAFAGTTPHAYFAGATVAAVMLAEDIAASAPWKVFEQYVTSGTVATFNPTNIPSGYRSLYIEWGAITDQGAGQQLLMQANGDTGANYSWSAMLALIGGTTIQSSGTNQTSARIGTAGTVYAAGALTIHNYAIASIGTYRQYTGAIWQDSDATGATGFTGGEWKNSANALNALTIFGAAGNLKAGSWLRIFAMP